MPGAQNDRSSPGSRARGVEFSRPPVVETILGIQFEPIQGLTLPYMGLFWADVRARYPQQEVKGTLPALMEQFADAPVMMRLGIELSMEPDARCWFIDETSTQLIQVQRDRFIRNWRKGPPPHDGYPRYERLRPGFETDWQLFLEFLDREGLGEPAVNQCEVTYINHVELGTGGISLGETHRALTLLKPQEGRRFLPEPETVLVNARYVMPEQRGRLHVASQPAVRRLDGKQVLQVTLTARGKPVSSRLSDIVTWFDLGHDWIVNGFVDMTTPAMHELWGLE